MPLKLVRRHREFIGQVGTVVSGRTAAAAVSLLLTPVVARIYAPEDFGIAALLFAIAGIAVQVASLKYETAIALPKDDAEAMQVATLSYRLVPASCLLLLVAIAAIQWAGPPAGLALLGHWIWLLPLVVLLMAAQDVQESWLSRKLAFGLVGKTVVADVAVGQAGRIGLGLLGGSSVAGLVFGQLAGIVVRFAWQGRASLETLRAALRPADWRALRAVASRYSDFAWLAAPAALLNVGSQNVPVLVFGMLYSPAAAGFFAIASRLSRIPVQIGATSLRRVFLQRAARIHNEGRPLRRSFVLTTLGLLAIGALPAFVLWEFGQPVLTFLLGAKWADAGRYLEIIAPWVLSMWVSAPCNPVYIVLRKQREWLILQAVTTAFRLAFLAVGYFAGLAAEQTLALFVLASVAANLFMIGMVWAYTGDRPADAAPA